MMTFKVLVGGKPPPDIDLDSAYMTSLEGQPVRARFQYARETGLLFCERRGEGLAALNIPWSVQSGSRLMLRTALLPDRGERPYLASLELARGRLGEVWRKKDDWGYIYGGPSEAIEAEIHEIKMLLARAQTIQDSALAANDLAEEALGRAVTVGERLAAAAARRGMIQRQRNGELGRVDFGCTWDSADAPPRARERFGEAFNYATVPMAWRGIEPREHEYDWKWHDGWIHWLEAKGIAIKGGSLVRFTDRYLPDWIWIWENDFETIRDAVFDHVERCVQRYRGRVDHWDAVTGLHVENGMNFSLDRVIEVTRVCCHAVKRADPAALAVLDLVTPWGEYYAANQRSIWPYHYAEMCLNAGVTFDAVGLEIFFGAKGQGYYVRDMLAVSDLLDRFGALGKPVHLTAVGVPSASSPDPSAAVGGAGANHGTDAGGVWHQPWDESVQAEWLQTFYHVAMGKPFVTAISWRDFSDHQAHYFPHGGLLRKDLQPKIAYQRLLGLRQEIWPDAVGGEEPSNVLWPEI